MRRIAVSLISLVTVAAMALSSAPSAFAMRLPPVPEGNAAPIVVAAPHQAGPAIWQLSLVAAGAAVLLAAICAGVVWSSRRIRVRAASAAATAR
jgi:hypothetical protein